MVDVISIRWTAQYVSLFLLRGISIYSSHNVTRFWTTGPSVNSEFWPGIEKIHRWPQMITAAYCAWTWKTLQGILDTLHITCLVLLMRSSLISQLENGERKLSKSWPLKVYNRINPSIGSRDRKVILRPQMIPGPHMIPRPQMIPVIPGTSLFCTVTSMLCTPIISETWVSFEATINDC